MTVNQKSELNKLKDSKDNFLERQMVPKKKLGLINLILFDRQGGILEFLI